LAKIFSVVSASFASGETLPRKSGLVTLPHQNWFGNTAPENWFGVLIRSQKRISHAKSQQWKHIQKAIAT